MADKTIKLDNISSDCTCHRIFLPRGLDKTYQLDMCIPRIMGNIDMQTCSYYINVKNANNEAVYYSMGLPSVPSNIPTSVTYTDQYVTIHWIIDSFVTEAVGTATYNVEARRSSSGSASVVWKSFMREIIVTEDIVANTEHTYEIPVQDPIAEGESYTCDCEGIPIATIRSICV